jgi:hypothetical protein
LGDVGRGPGRKVEWLFDWVAVAGAVAYLCAFLYKQTPSLLDRHFMEWDARAFNLPAWRYHGTGLFPGDFVTDYYRSLTPPGWRLVYWIGTLFTDPVLVSKLLPFLLLAIAVWHGFALGRSFGGLMFGAACAVLLVHAAIFWDRMSGATPRACGYPLLLAFLHYSATKRERAAAITCVAAALLYPSALLLCLLAYGLTLLVTRDRARWRRFVITSVVSLAVLFFGMWNVDSRFGHPPTYAEAATLRQMGPGGCQLFYPMKPWRSHLEESLRVLSYSSGAAVLPRIQAWNQEHDQWPAISLLVILSLGAATRIRKVPLVLPAMLLGSLVAYVLARAAAYRLYLPERMFEFAWSPIVLLAAPMIAMQAISWLTQRQAGRVAAVVLVFAAFAFYGDGLPKTGYGVWDWSPFDTPEMNFIAQLPKDTTVAAHLWPSTYIQLFARRKTLFSQATNTVQFTGYGIEMERRIESFLRAYYGRDLSDVRSFAAREHVNYLLVDSRDFGSQALARSAEKQPWLSLNRQLLAETPPANMALAHVPEAAVAYRNGPVTVVDCSKL